MPVAGGDFGIYFRIVRGGTRRPSFSSSSFAIRSSPPRGILARDSLDQTLQLDRDWPPASFGLPAPEQAEALAVPGDQGLGGLTTIKASRQLNQRLSSTSARRVGLSARRGLTLRS